MNSENEFLSIHRVYRVTSSQEDQNNQCGRMFIYRWVLDEAALSCIYAMETGVDPVGSIL